MKHFILCFLFLTGALSYSQTADEYLEMALKQYSINPMVSSVRTNFNNALKLEPKNEKVLYEFAKYDIEKGAYYEAQDLLTTLLEIVDNNPEYYWQRVRVLVRRNSLKKELLMARDDLEKAIELGFNDTLKIKKANELIDEYLKL
ncbi:tetratricopeptide repeat protein [Allomuricauda sp. M10]|uniref:tetratricopeptide repeat protein n=1 Tax=Allomuricauda sp. M10 TaxID=2683292 RepID=UPI001D1982BC|nr:hypothetical protein [Muricauda sp. M10]